MTYHEIAFGSPFRVGYTFYDDPRTMKAGLLGISVPQTHILGELLFGWYRGLLPAAPLFALVPVGWWLFVRDRSTRPIAVALGVAVAAAITMMAGDVHWEGGWTYGPRYIAFVMGFMGLMIAPLWTRGNSLVRAGVVVLALAGAAGAVVAVSTTAQPSGEVMHPMRDLLWPAFRSGDLALNTMSVLDLRPAATSAARRAAWNVGMRLGLRGLYSLIPLAVVWCLAAGGLWATRPRSAIASRDPERWTRTALRPRPQFGVQEGGRPGV
jgi:hypothetical protein